MPQACYIGDRPLPMASPPRKVDEGKDRAASHCVADSRNDLNNTRGRTSVVFSQTNTCYIRPQTNPGTHSRANPTSQAIAATRPLPCLSSTSPTSARTCKTHLSPVSVSPRSPTLASTSQLHSCSRSKVSSPRSSSAAHHHPPPASHPASAMSQR